MAEKTLITTGQQTDTAPAVQAPVAVEGTAPAESAQQQPVIDAAPAADPAKADEKPAEDAKVEPKAPAEYVDFKSPEGYALDPALGAEFKAIAKELDLTQEQAQKLIDLDAKRATSQVEALHKTSADWFAATQADKELGGDNLAQTVAIAQKALATFGTPELSKLLKESGLGNNPEVIRAFYRAGKAISEDTFVPAGSGDIKGPAGAASALYPNQKQT